MHWLDVRGVLFDLDGTLVDSAPDLAQAINAVLADLGRTAVSLSAVRQWVGNGADRLLERALTGELNGRLPAAELEAIRPQFVRYYGQALCVGSRLYPGVLDGVKAVYALGLSVGCVTNKPSRFARPLLDQLGIGTYFTAVVGGDDAPHKKPHPAPLLLATERLGLRPEQCLMVGDSQHDVAAARAAGCPVIAVPYGYNHGQDIRAAQPDSVIDSLAQLAALLRPAA